MTDKIRYAAGIDLGGTFVKFAMVSEDGRIFFEDKQEIGSKATRDDILDILSVAIQRIIAYANLKGVNILGIGIGSPGIVYDGVVIGGADNLNGWANVHLGTLFSGKEITDNFYWLSTVKDVEGTKIEAKSPRGFDWDLFIAKPKSVADFTVLEKLPKVELENSLEIQQDSTEIRAVAKLKNKGKYLAFMVHLALTKGKDGDEVSPAYWSDNYFSLFPDETKEIKGKFNKVDLGNSPAMLKVYGWNVLH